MKREELKEKHRELTYLIAHVAHAPVYSIPAGLRIPFGWGAVPIGHASSGAVTKISWDDGGHIGHINRLRITVALDVREEKLIEVFLLKSGRSIGTFDIRYAYVFQPFELPLDDSSSVLAIREGIGFRMLKGELPLWFFCGEGPSGKADGIFLPHLLACDNDNGRSQFHQRIGSLSSMQIFGWMEGCVLDGLMDLAHAYRDKKFSNMAQEHLDRFFPERKGLTYENAWSIPFDGKIYGIEATLPYAALAQLNPEHPALKQAIEFWYERRRKDGSIQDGDCLSAEGAYTVAYPMAVISKKEKNKSLGKMAVEQLCIRQERLIIGNALYLRHYDSGEKTFKNWARSYAWYMLGFIRTIETLESDELQGDIEREFVRISDIVLRYQLDNGLWACFIDEPEVVSDTSGSAGIAAALAKGYLYGLLSEDALTASKRTLEALRNCLTPDGLLSGVAQGNRGGGESLQRSNYRVISQMGMGLMAQLEAAIHRANIYEKSKGRMV